jgi:hypothetical protein
LRRYAWGTAFLTACICLVGASPIAAQSLPGHPEAENSGQDPTRPVTRVDVRLKYQDNPSGSEAQFMTLRADKPYLIRGGWKLSTRVDLPLVRNNVITPGNVSGDYQGGLGDVLTQALFLSPPHGRTTFGFGTQLIMPTGTKTQFTTGKWQLAPSALAVVQLPKISRGSFVGILVKDTFSFAGKVNRPNINVVSMQPIFNWALPDRWFATFGPEAKFNGKDHWKPFVPLDVTIGKKINARTVMSLQADIALIDRYRQYDWQTEFRIGFFF